VAAWIQNGTLRENVLFGQPWDEHRYWQSIKDASLVTDLEILPDGDLTEVRFTSEHSSKIVTDRTNVNQIGEKGVYSV